MVSHCAFRYNHTQMATAVLVCERIYRGSTAGERLERLLVCGVRESEKRVKKYLKACEKVFELCLPLPHPKP